MSTRTQSPPKHWVLIGMLVLAAGLMLMPPRVAAPLRAVAASALRPGQEVAARAVDWSETAVAWLGAARERADEVIDLRRQLAAARERCRTLEHELLLARSRSQAAGRLASAEGPDDPLLISHLVEARVLGEEAAGVLQRRQLLSAGSTAGIEPTALVLDRAASLVDRGADAGVGAGHAVLAGRAVAGRVSEVQPWTCVVQSITDREYRALAQIVHREAAGTPDALLLEEAGLLAPNAPAGLSSGLGTGRGARGILEGTGDDLCRLRLVEATEPVAVGDLVVTAGDEGVLPYPLLYGSVVRAEVPPGAAHWDIWVEPAVRAADLRTVQVLRLDVNPRRIAESPDGASRQRAY